MHLNHSGNNTFSTAASQVQCENFNQVCGFMFVNPEFITVQTHESDEILMLVVVFLFVAKIDDQYLVSKPFTWCWISRRAAVL